PDHPDHEHPPPAVVVAQGPAKQQEPRQGEGVGVDHPLEAGDAGVQVLADGGQGHVDDGGVEEGDARPEHRGQQDPSSGPAAVAQPAGVGNGAAVWGSTSSPRSGASGRIRARCCSPRWVGVTTATWASRSPRPRPAGWGTPRLRERLTSPDGVPASTSTVSVPSRVSSGTLPPRAAMVIGTSTVQMRSSPRRSKTGWGSTASSTIRSPGGPPNWPAWPRPWGRIW